MRLHGRDEQIATLDAALARSAEAVSSTVVLTGEAGVGKSALLAAVVEKVRDSVLVLPTGGVESESDVGYGGLHRLLAPLLAQVGSLPAPQRSALETAFGLAEGPPPDRFHVGLAALTLVTDAAAERPVLCVVDDAHWLDRESLHALGFVARRLLIDRVMLLFAVREPGSVPALTGLDELLVDRLDEVATRALLDDLYGREVDRRVASRVADETAGNPLVLHELARTHPLDQLGQIELQPRPLTLDTVVHRGFTARVCALPAEARLLLLVVAADQRADGHLMARAGERMGIPLDALDAAEVEGLIEVSDHGPTFRHPLVRAACYQAATPGDRRRAHAVLAEILTDDRDLERQAWHLALSVVGPDEDTAQRLVAAAVRARQRGAIQSEVELLARAAELTPDGEEAGVRHLQACAAASVVADQVRVAQLVERARRSITNPVLLPVVAHVEAVAPVLARRFGRAPAQLMAVARQVDEHDRSRSRRIALEALFMYGTAHPLVEGTSAVQLAEAIRAMPPTAEAPPSVADLLLDGYATVILEGWPAGAGPLREACRRWPEEVTSPGAVHRHLGPPIWAASSLWDADGLGAILGVDAEICRRSSAWNPLRSMLVFQARFDVACGRFNQAEVVAAEVADLSVMMDGEANWQAFVTAETLAWRGCADAAEAAIAEADGIARTQQLGTGLHMAQVAAASLANGTRRYADAVEAARPVAEDRISVYGSQALLELAEALCRLGRDDELGPVLAEIARRAEASGTPWARGVAARVEAMALTGADADDRHREAIALLATTDIATEHARALLVHGEWLRRDRRRVDARRQLREAHGLFSSMGAAAFAERARIELEATGEHVLRVAHLHAHLTPQERQVAILAREGTTNKEIAARLFISAATVDYHLRKVYRKLGIGSRRDLTRVDLA